MSTVIAGMLIIKCLHCIMNPFTVNQLPELEKDIIINNRLNLNKITLLYSHELRQILAV